MASKMMLALLLVAAVAEARVSYDGYKVLSVHLRTKAEAKFINELEHEGVDVWSAVIGKNAHLLVSPYELSKVNTTLVEAGMYPTVAIRNVQELIDLETEAIQAADEQRGRASWIGKSFVRYSEIVAWLESLPSTCGNKCAVSKIGTSFEKRDIYAVRISNDINASGNRKVLFFEANIHAREWLSHASVAFVIDAMLDGYGVNSRITDAMDKFEWHFIVLSNPDGYEYSWTNDRLWRKTRSPQGVCTGVDANRNFDSHHCGEGTSNNACSQTFCGSRPFSESETQVIRDYTTPLASRLVVFNSVHTYSQLLLLPWAYAANTYPSDFTELMRVGRAMTDAIYQNSRKIYTVGNTVDLLYEAAGSTHDWAREKLNVKYPMTWELRPNQNAVNGFVVAPSEIAPTGTELLQALLTESEVIQI